MVDYEISRIWQNAWLDIKWGKMFCEVSHLMQPGSILAQTYECGD